MSIYDYKVKTQDGEEISMDCYKRKTLLIVNTATGCGFTPQYSELQEIYDEFHDRGWKFWIFHVTSSQIRRRAMTMKSMIFAPEDMESHSRNFPKLR